MARRNSAATVLLKLVQPKSKKVSRIDQLAQPRLNPNAYLLPSLKMNSADQFRWNDNGRPKSAKLPRRIALSATRLTRCELKTDTAHLRDETAYTRSGVKKSGVRGAFSGDLSRLSAPPRRWSNSDVNAHDPATRTASGVKK